MQVGQKLNEIFLEKYLKKFSFFGLNISKYFRSSYCAQCAVQQFSERTFCVYTYTYCIRTRYLQYCPVQCTLRFKNVHFLSVCALHGLYYCFTDVIAVRANIIHDENIVSMTNFVFKHYFLCKLPEDIYKLKMLVNSKKSV